jgi:hypothetical protein
MSYNPIHPHCGPFNVVDEKEPSNEIDAICWRHDKKYGEMGPSAYLYYNEADEEFLEEMEGVGNLSSSVYSSFFYLKKRSFIN